MKIENIQRIEIVARLPARSTEAHKGQFGSVLVVGGSRGMVGAPALAANAALRGGAGLATVAVPRTIQLAVAAICPCATSLPLACGENDELAAESVRQVLSAAAACDVLAVGPGLTVGRPQQDLVRAAMEQQKPLVLDADGLNNLCRIDDWPGIRRCAVILTPHPGEFARLTGRDVKEIQADRQNAAVTAVRRWTGRRTENRPPLVCALKGAGTVVTDGRRLYVNDTGNAGMATGGAGDVLTGLAAAILGQGLEPFEAACLAVRCHGLAGDLAARKLGQTSLIASDLLDYLPAALQQID